MFSTLNPPCPLAVHSTPSLVRIVGLNHTFFFIVGLDHAFFRGASTPAWVNLGGGGVKQFGVVGHVCVLLLLCCINQLEFLANGCATSG